MTVWAVTLAAIAVVFLVVIPIWGIVAFNPNRARSVKIAERDNVVIEHEHVVQARLAHPEIVKVGRIDRHPFFLLPHVGVFCYAICIMFGARLTNNVSALGAQTRYTMAACFIIGSTLVLTGAALGGRVGRWHIVRAVHDHVTADVLGDDIALPYRLSMAGQFAIAVSMLIYSSTSFQITAGSLGGWLTGALAVACGITIPWFWIRVRTFDRWESTLIGDAMKRLGMDDVRSAG